MASRSISFAVGISQPAMQCYSGARRAVLEGDVPAAVTLASTPKSHGVMRIPSFTENTPASPSSKFGRPAAHELSVVMPCLNEADTLAACIGQALRALQEQEIAGEIIVADNGSSDGSREIAQQLGVRVVRVAERGYGAALMGGIAAARGTYVIMADADDSYDFGEIPRILSKLREGWDLVQGCRLEAGGGQVLPDAMPFLHRWWGNPMFSWMARRWFRAPVHDIHCGMRGFRLDSWQRLDQRCTGMEFASEMVIKASLHGLKIAEVPIVLRPDGRTKGRSHLRTFRDGWRHLRFFLMFSPRWLFLLPGLAFILVGVAGYAVAMPATSIGRFGFGVHTLLFASLAIISGCQAILFAVFTKACAINEGLLPADARMGTLARHVTLERGVLLGTLSLLAGAGLLAGAVFQWSAVDFGPLDVTRTMRWAIPGMMFAVLGVQTIFSSFFLSILGMQRR
jgi:glycosyltransferase involved in cell wall biosynthesis